MIIGSGLLAREFYSKYACNEDVCIYAAGVSNSACTDIEAFQRENNLLSSTLKKIDKTALLVYFGTCSVLDSGMVKTPYVEHKKRMEGLALTHSNTLILRLPQLAGHTKNPNTLLNYLYKKIINEDFFYMWSKASRNIIDVSDVAMISAKIIENKQKECNILNIANIENYTMDKIILEMETILKKKALYKPIEKGENYYIDTSLIRKYITNLDMIFDNNYLKNILTKYYGKK